jgi:hypothetical protein
MSGAMESSGLQSTNFVYNNKEYIVLGGGFLAFMVGMVFIIKCKKLVGETLKNKVLAKYKGIKAKFLFNGKIKALTMTYLKMTIEFSATYNILLGWWNTPTYDASLNYIPKMGFWESLP